jgi:hypothetical protein
MLIFNLCRLFGILFSQQQKPPTHTHRASTASASSSVTALSSQASAFQPIAAIPSSALSQPSPAAAAAPTFNSVASTSTQFSALSLDEFLSSLSPSSLAASSSSSLSSSTSQSSMHSTSANPSSASSVFTDPPAEALASMSPAGNPFPVAVAPHTPVLSAAWACQACQAINPAQLVSCPVCLCDRFPVVNADPTLLTVTRQEYNQRLEALIEESEAIPPQPDEIMLHAPWGKERYTWYELLFTISQIKLGECCAKLWSDFYP